MDKYDGIKEWIREHVKYDMVCVDIGAGNGDLTILMSGLVGDHRGNVYAYEPDVKRYLVLKDRVIAEGCTNVVCRNMAVMDDNSPYLLTPDGVVSKSVRSGLATDGATAVAGGTLDDLLAVIGRIDAVVVHSSVDIEAVRLGASRTLMERQPALIGEIEWQAH